MNKDAARCFDTAASMLRQSIDRGSCQPSVAHDIVMQIALGTIRWSNESS